MSSAFKRQSDAFQVKSELQTGIVTQVIVRSESSVHPSHAGWEVVRSFWYVVHFEFALQVLEIPQVIVCIQNAIT